MKTNRLLLLLTFVSSIVCGPCIYAQQEVDPTWYDPWSGPNHAAANTSLPQAQPDLAVVAPKAAEADLVSASPHSHAAQLSSKPAVSPRTGHSSPAVPDASLPANVWISELPVSPSRNDVRFYGAGSAPWALAATTRIRKTTRPSEL